MDHRRNPRVTPQQNAYAWSQWDWDEGNKIWVRSREDGNGSVVWQWGRRVSVNGPVIPCEQSTEQQAPVQNQMQSQSREDPRYIPGLSASQSSRRNDFGLPSYPKTSLGSAAGQSSVSPRYQAGVYETYVPQNENEYRTSDLYSLSGNQPVNSFSSGYNPTTSIDQGLSSMGLDSRAQATTPRPTTGTQVEDTFSESGMTETAEDAPSLPRKRGKNKEPSRIVRGPSKPKSKMTHSVAKSSPTGDSALIGQVEPSRKITTDKISTGLNQDFEVHKSKKFMQGRVFRVVWSEPKGVGQTEVTTLEEETEIGGSLFNENAYHSIRRFVVARSFDGHSICIPILTYNHQGTAKLGLRPQHHTIIYTTAEAPKELPGEPRLHKRPVKVKPLTPRIKLSHDSRLNYAKIYTVEHNVKVQFIGKIDENDMHTFNTDFDRTFHGE